MVNSNKEPYRIPLLDSATHPHRALAPSLHHDRGGMEWVRDRMAQRTTRRSYMMIPTTFVVFPGGASDGECQQLTTYREVVREAGWRINTEASVFWKCGHVYFCTWTKRMSFSPFTSTKYIFNSIRWDWQKGSLASTVRLRDDKDPGFVLLF